MPGRGTSRFPFTPSSRDERPLMSRSTSISTRDRGGVGAPRAHCWPCARASPRMGLSIWATAGKSRRQTTTATPESVDEKAFARLRAPAYGVVFSSAAANIGKADASAMGPTAQPIYDRGADGAWRRHERGRPEALGRQRVSTRLAVIVPTPEQTSPDHGLGEHFHD